MTDFSVWQRCQGARSDGMRCCRRGRAAWSGYAWYCQQHRIIAMKILADGGKLHPYPKAFLGTWRPGRRPSDED